MFKMFSTCIRAHHTLYTIPNHFSVRTFRSSAIIKSIITQNNLSPSKIITIPSTPRINIFSFSQSRRYTTTIIQNPQKYEEGNDMHIEITDRAVNKLKSVTEQEKKPFNNALRVTVDSGGCHGFQYFYDLTEQNSFKEDDIVFEKDGVKVVVDVVSLGMIKGSKIDYSEELIGSQFQVADNPQAASGCGCGISFEIKA